MTYRVMMICVPNERAVPAYELEGPFATRETAVAAAARELASRSFEPSAGFQIFNAEEELVLAVPLAAATDAAAPSAGGKRPKRRAA